MSLGTPPGAAPTPDAFDGVRAEAQAAFERGARHFERKEYDLALIELDRARLHDPDNRADIIALLNSTLSELGAKQPNADPSPTADAPQATATPYTVALPPVPAPKASPAAKASPAPTPAAAPQVRMQAFEDAEKRFTIDFPREWQTQDRPDAEAGAGVVSFKRSASRASFVVSLDAQRQVVSPELYAAHLETQMSTLPGYQLEHANPVLLNGAPALRRQFTVQRVGEVEQFKTVQVVVSRRSWIFILTASAPSGEFARMDAIFDQMIKSFRITA